MTFGISIFCFACFLAFSSIAMFAPRRAPAAATVRRAPQPIAPEPVRIATVAWPAAVDARATGAEPAVRLALARELGTCRGRWAYETIVVALAEEPDPQVRAALAEAHANVRA
jgi:hypothetical protein